jgi:hypothetical protein
MAIVWPASLDSAVLRNWSEVFPDRTIRFQTEVGAAKVRQRTTSTAGVLEVPMAMTAAQVATLYTFFDTTTSGGSLRFEWQHPRTGATHEMRFLEPPTVTESNRGLYRTALKLEFFP